MIELAQRYRIERELGRGGMGVVHLAWDGKNRRNVAVKVLRPEVAAVVGRDRFLREIEVAGSLSHPHILPLHDSGEEDGSLYYVMPYVAGETLADRMRREGMLDIADSLRIAGDVADALAYAHQRGIVHRDIKPANVLLDAGHAIVSDFGLAILISSIEESRLTSTGITVGTPIYMSPEQSLGRRDVDGRSDIYSLGCVLYEMLCGEAPFGTREPQAILARKMGTPPPMRVARETIPESVERITFKALCRNPADRFRSAGDLGQALRVATMEQHLASPAQLVIDSIDGGATATARTGTNELRPFSLAWNLAAAGAVLGVCVLSGLLANRVYDVTLGMPAAHSSNVLQALRVGPKALAPGLILGTIWFAAYLLVKQLVRLFIAWLNAEPSIEQSLRNWRSSTGTLRRAATISPAIVAEVLFAASIVASFAVLFLFGSFLSEIWNGNTSIFAKDCHDLYHRYSIAMSGAVVALAGGWLRALRYLRARSATPSSLRLVRIGGAVVILVMILSMTAAWRLYFDNDRPRALLEGQPVYLLHDEPDDIVLYHARTREVRHFHRAVPALTRLGTEGYIYEHETGCSTSAP